MVALIIKSLLDALHVVLLFVFHEYSTPNGNHFIKLSLFSLLILVLFFVVLGKVIVDEVEERLLASCLGLLGVVVSGGLVFASFLLLQVDQPSY